MVSGLYQIGGFALRNIASDLDHFHVGLARYHYVSGVDATALCCHIFCSAGSPVVQVCLPVVVLIGSPVSALDTHHCVVTILGI